MATTAEESLVAIPSYSHIDVVPLSNTSPKRVPETQIPSIELQGISNEGQMGVREEAMEAGVEYPTGFKFAIVIVATLLTLVLVGLVSLSAIARMKALSCSEAFEGPTSLTGACPIG